MDVIRGLADQTWVHVAFGAMLMGGWAFFANRQHAPADAGQAALLQGALSGVLTGCLKTIADRLRRALPRWWQAAALSLMFSVTLLLTAHWVAGTPELLATVAVPLLVSGSYIFGYCYLRREAPHG